MTKFDIIDKDGDVACTLTATSLDSTPTAIEGTNRITKGIAAGYMEQGYTVKTIAARVGGSYEPHGVKERDEKVQKDALAELADLDDTVEIEAQGQIVSKSDEKQCVFGWAYVTHDKDGQVSVDKSGDFVDEIEEIEKTAYRFMLNSRDGDIDHANLKSSEMVESMVFTPEKIEKMGIPEGVMPLGWWVGFHFADRADWAIAKTRTAFSVHGKGTRKSVE